MLRLKLSGLGTINKLPEVTEPVIARLSNGDAIKTRWTDLSSQFSNTFIFGTVKFTIDFNTIITSYRNSYASTDKEVKVLYKQAGTLRYPQQPGYIIIICVEEGGIDPFPEMETLTLDGLVIKQPYKKMEYKIETSNGDTTSKGGIDVSWEIYSLAFHFPEHHPIRPLGNGESSRVAISPIAHSLCINPYCREKDSGSLYKLKEIYDNSCKAKEGHKVNIDIV